MTEGRAAQCQDRGPDLRVGDDLDSEDIGESWATIVAEGAEDEVFALLIEY